MTVAELIARLEALDVDQDWPVYLHFGDNWVNGGGWAPMQDGDVYINKSMERIEIS